MANEEIIMTGSADGTLRVWSSATLELMHRIPVHDIDLSHCESGRCGRGIMGLDITDGLIVASGWEGRVKIGRIESLPHLEIVNKPRRGLGKVAIRGDKGFSVCRVDGRLVCRSKYSSSTQPVLAH